MNNTWLSTCYLPARTLVCLTLAVIGYLAGMPLLQADSTSPVTYSVSPAHAWVKHTESSFSELEYLEGSEESLHYLLVDRQIRLPQSSSHDAHFYYRYSYQIRNVDGLQNGSSNSIEFDPNYEKLILHRVSVWRDGVETNRTNSAKLQLLHGENEREELIYNGEYALDFVLSDTRIGDVVDYSYTIVGSNPVFEYLQEFGFKQNWGVPVEQVNYRLIAPSGSELVQRKQGNANLFKLTATPTSLEYNFSQSHIDAVDHKDSARVTLSNVADWGSIVDWAVPLYKNAVSSSLGVEPIAAKIKQQYTSKEAQIGAALIWAQSNVRYLGLEYGTNSHRPSPAHETLQRRFGDCKDKAVLLVAILQALGIESNAALVHSGKHTPIPESPYRLKAFNHVIVHLELGGKSHWLDPTKLYQKGALGEFSEPDYGHALVIKPGNKSLSEMTSNELDSRVAVNKTLALSKDGEVEMTVSTTRTLAEAERHRARLTQDGMSDFAKSYEEFYQKTIDGIKKTKGLTVEDKPDNSIVTTENYAFNFSVHAEGSNKQAFVGADDIDSALESIEDLELDDDKSAAEIERPFYIQESISIEYPHDILSDNSQRQIKNKFFDFSYQFDSDQNTRKTTLDFSLKIKQKNVPASMLESVKADAVEAQDLLYMYLKHPLVDDGEYRLGKLSLLFKEWETGIIIGVIVLGVLIYLYALIEWQLDRRRAARGGVFYPVSGVKFWLMMFSTLGAYSVFYFYCSFRYSRDHLNKKIWPAVRALFYSFFMWSLISHVRELDNNQASSLRIKPFRAFVLSFLFLTLTILGSNHYPMISSLLAALCLFPLLKWINSLNLDDVAPTIQHSRIRPRHILLVIFSPLLFISTIPSELNLMPSSNVVPGWQMWKFQEKYLADRQVIEDKESIQLFYSSAQYDFRLDGNGLTNKALFSYWVEDDGLFQYASVKFIDIDSISIRNDTSNDLLPNALVEAVSKSGDKITLILPNSEECKAKFFTQLKRALPSTARFSCRR